MRYVTRKRIRRGWRPFTGGGLIEHTLDIPAGTRVEPIRNVPQWRGRFWIAEFGWCGENEILYSDAYHYGIVLEPEEVTDAEA